MKGKILVVDDREYITLMVRLWLSNEGYDVSTAYGYYDAREMLAKVRFDIVITDIDLSDVKTGIDVLKEAKRKNPACHVILMTGNPGLLTESDAKLMGVDDYKIKPFEYKELLQSVSMALQSDVG